MHPPKLVCVRSIQTSPQSPSYFSTTSFTHSEEVAVQMVATYATKGKGVASNAGVNLSSLILMAKHIRFTYSDDEDEVASCPAEDVEE